MLAVLASLLAVLAVAATALRREAAPAVVLLVALAVDGWAHVADADILTRSDLQTAVACLFLLAASYVIRVEVPRILTESAAGLVAVVALALASDNAAHFAATLTVVGTAVALLAVLRHDRVHLGWVGSAVLTAGTLVRLDLPTSIGAEVYTLPAAALLIAAGVHRLLREPTTGTWTVLGSGLTLALVPSLLISLPEPTSLRAFLVGTGAAVALVVGMERRWQAPFLAGAAVLGVLALRFLLPLAQEVLANPLGAWMLFGSARRRLPGGRHPVGAVAAQPAARLAVRRGPALRSLRPGPGRSTPPGASSGPAGRMAGWTASTTRSAGTRSRGSSRGSTRGSPPTRCCGRSTPRRTSARRRSGSPCSCSSTGVAPRRTRTGAAIRGCGCGTRRSRSPRVAAQHWLVHFRAGLDSAQLTPEQDAKFWDYVTHAAQFMVNTFEE